MSLARAFKRLKPSTSRRAVSERFQLARALIVREARDRTSLASDSARDPNSRTRNEKITGPPGATVREAAAIRSGAPGIRSPVRKRERDAAISPSRAIQCAGRYVADHSIPRRRVAALGSVSALSPA